MQAKVRVRGLGMRPRLTGGIVRDVQRRFYLRAFVCCACSVIYLGKTGECFRPAYETGCIDTSSCCTAKNKRNKTRKVFKKVIEASSDNGTGQFAAECEKAPATEGDLTSYGAYKNVPIFWPPSRYT